MALIVIIFSFLFSLSVKSDIGYLNGDFSIHAVVCGETVELLDYKELYEIDSNYEFNLPGSTTRDYLDGYFTRMESFAPFRTKLYSSWLDSIDSKIKFVKNVNFGETRDHTNFFQWDNCKIKILAKAINPFDEGKTFFIDKILWNKLSEKSKAGVFFNYFLNIEHIIYSGNEHTEYTRYFNALIASNIFKTLKPSRDYFPLYELLDFKAIAHKGILFSVYTLSGASGKVQSIRYDDNGEIILGKIVSPRSNVFSLSSIDFGLKFLNASAFKIEFWEKKLFKPNDNGEFYMSSLKNKKEVNCIGKYDLSEVEYVDLNLKIIGAKLKIISIHGNMQFDGKVVEGIYFDKESFEVKFDDTRIPNDYRDYVITSCAK